MENELVLVCVNGKTFVGKLETLPEGGKTLMECIETIPVMGANGQYMILGNLLGHFKIPGEALIITLSPESIYYKNYFQVTSGVQIVKPGTKRIFS